MAQRTTDLYDNILTAALGHVQKEIPYRKPEDNVHLKEMNERFIKLNGIQEWSEDQKLLDSARVCVNDLKLVHHTLSDHLRTLDKLVESTERFLLPFEFEKGFQMLPDDLLKMIFEEFDEVGELQLVCKRFRMVAMKTPRLWRKISNSMPSIKHLLRSLCLAGSTGLQIGLHIGNPDMTIDGERIVIWVHEAVKIVRLHYLQWEELNIYASLRRGVDTEFWNAIFHALQLLVNLELPRLHTMRYEVSSDCAFLQARENPKHFAHFYMTLRLPSLRRLETINFIPFLSPSRTPALTSVRLDLRTRFDAIRLLDFLATIPKLEDLTLHLTHSCCSSIPETLPDLHLQNLMALEIKAPMESCVRLWTLMDILLTPTVRKLRIIFEVSHPQPEVGDWMSFVLRDNEYPLLEDLSVEIVLKERDIIEIPFHKVPNLRSLSVYSPYVDVQMPPDGVRMPALQTIKIHSDLPSWLNYLQLIKAKLENQGGSESLKNVVILRRKWDAVRAAKETFDGLQVEWKEDDRKYLDDCHTTEWPGVYDDSNLLDEDDESDGDDNENVGEGNP